MIEDLKDFGKVSDQVAIIYATECWDRTPGAWLPQTQRLRIGQSLRRLLETDSFEQLGISMFQCGVAAGEPSNE